MNTRLTLLCSHRGTLYSYIHDLLQKEHLPVDIVKVICNNASAPVVAEANRRGTSVFVIGGALYQNEEIRDRKIMETLDESSPDWILLAGYLRRLGPLTVGKWSGRIVNIHPSLLPKYGGQGMFGEAVHQAVLKGGDSISGVSLHLVDNNYDTGPVIGQKSFALNHSESLESLVQKVAQAEKDLIREWISNMGAASLSMDS